MIRFTLYLVAVFCNSGLVMFLFCCCFSKMLVNEWNTGEARRSRTGEEKQCSCISKIMNQAN